VGSRGGAGGVPLPDLQRAGCGPHDTAVREDLPASVPPSLRGGHVLAPYHGAQGR
jgi:hypothetical protein